MLFNCAHSRKKHLPLSSASNTSLTWVSIIEWEIRRVRLTPVDIWFCLVPNGTRVVLRLILREKVSSARNRNSELSLLPPKESTTHEAPPGTQQSWNQKQISKRVQHHNIPKGTREMQTQEYYSLLSTIKWRDARTRTRGVRTSSSMLVRASHGDIIIKS